MILELGLLQNDIVVFGWLVSRTETPPKVPVYYSRPYFVRGLSLSI